MPKFQVTVADEAGHKLYDETIEAAGPREACGIAAAESATIEAPDHAGAASASGVPGSGTSPFEVEDNSTTPEPLLSDLAKENPAR